MGLFTMQISFAGSKAGETNHLRGACINSGREQIDTKVKKVLPDESQTNQLLFMLTWLLFLILLIHVT